MESLNSLMNTTVSRVGMRRGAQIGHIFHLWNSLLSGTEAKKPQLCSGTVYFQDYYRSNSICTQRALEEVLAMLHLSGKREWEQADFHKLLFFQVVQKSVPRWGKLSLHSLWDTAWYQQMNQQQIKGG